MDAYPFNLVLTVAVASATIAFGMLPTRLIRAPLFTRQVLGAGFFWMMVGFGSPVVIRHYPVVLGLLCLVAWWRLRHDRGLSGKMWLSFASGLGISVGVVLILAVTPPAFPPGLSLPGECLVLASLYLGGGVVGLAYALYIFTRPAATEAGISSALVHRCAGLLFGLTVARAVLFLVLPFFTPVTGSLPILTALIFGCILIVLPVLGRAAMRRSQSPRPSTSGLALIALCLIGFAAESLARIFVF